MNNNEFIKNPRFQIIDIQSDDIHLMMKINGINNLFNTSMEKNKR